MVDRIAYGAIFILSLLLGWRVANLGKHSERRVTPTEWAASTALKTDLRSVLALPPISLPYLVNGPQIDESGVGQSMTFPGQHDGRLLLLIVFTSNDCYAGYADIPFWSALREQFSENIDVIGVSSGEHREKLLYFLQSQDVRIPVVHDKMRVVFDFLEQIEAPPTPLLVLANDEGRVLHLERSASGNTTRREQYMRILHSFVRDQRG